MAAMLLPEIYCKNISDITEWNNFTISLSDIILKG